MKKYTRRQRPRRYGKQKTRSRRGGGSKRPTPAPTPAPTPTPAPRQSSRTTTSSSTSGRTSTAKLTPSKGVVVSRSRGHSHVNASSRAGKSKDDTQALRAATLVSNFPNNMDKFLEMVIYNHNLLSDNDVKIALQNKISINMFPATGRLSTNGIIFISYICGKLNHLLLELSRTNKSNVAKKIELLRKIKQIESVIYLLDDVGCSWGVRPYNAGEMKTIDDYYRIVNSDEVGLQEYYDELNELIDTYFPEFKVHRDPSHVVSSSMARLLIPRHVMHNLPTIDDTEEVD
jgi:hypothetical protein